MEGKIQQRTIKLNQNFCLLESCAAILPFCWCCSAILIELFCYSPSRCSAILLHIDPFNIALIVVILCITCAHCTVLYNESTFTNLPELGKSLELFKTTFARKLIKVRSFNCGFQLQIKLFEKFFFRFQIKILDVSHTGYSHNLLHKNLKTPDGWQDFVKYLTTNPEQNGKQY